MISVNPVSSMNFRGAEVADKAQDVNPFARPGAFADNAAADTVDLSNKDAAQNAGKKSGIGKKLLKTVGILAVIAAALVGLQKGGVVKTLESVEGASIMDKISHYTAKVGEAIAKYTVDPLMKLFKGKGETGANVLNFD